MAWQTGAGGDDNWCLSSTRLCCSPYFIQSECKFDVLKDCGAPANVPELRRLPFPISCISCEPLCKGQVPFLPKGTDMFSTRPDLGGLWFRGLQTETRRRVLLGRLGYYSNSSQSIPNMKGTCSDFANTG